MTDREKVMMWLKICGMGDCSGCCPYKNVELSPFPCYERLMTDALSLLKAQDNEAKRIMKVVWDTLHEGLSIDTVPDQDWVYELIRHRIEDR